jgi:hypothetical protein
MAIKIFKIVLLLLAVSLAGSGCITADGYYHRPLYTQVSSPLPMPYSGYSNLPECQSCTPGERLEYWRRMESLQRQKMYEREAAERSRGGFKADRTWETLQLYR